MDKELRAAFAGDERIRRPMAIPGIGFLTAAVVLAEVGDATRFACADQLASWAGLTPTVRSSDEHTPRGHISKQGSRWLRWVMVEAASRSVRDPALRRFEDGIARRRGAKTARVALRVGCSRCASMRCGTKMTAGPSRYAHAPRITADPSGARQKS